MIEFRRLDARGISRVLELLTQHVQRHERPEHGKVDLVMLEQVHVFERFASTQSQSNTLEERLEEDEEVEGARAASDTVRAGFRRHDDAAERIV